MLPVASCYGGGWYTHARTHEMYGNSFGVLTLILSGRLIDTQDYNMSPVGTLMSRWHMIRVESSSFSHLNLDTIQLSLRG